MCCALVWMHTHSSDNNVLRYSGMSWTAGPVGALQLQHRLYFWNDEQHPVVFVPSASQGVTSERMGTKAGSVLRLGGMLLSLRGVQEHTILWIPLLCCWRDTVIISAGWIYKIFNVSSLLQFFPQSIWLCCLLTFQLNTAGACLLCWSGINTCGIDHLHNLNPIAQRRTKEMSVDTLIVLLHVYNKMN